MEFPRYELKKTKDDKYHFVLKSRNGRVILSSETYVTEQGARNGIRSCQENGSELEQYEISLSESKTPYFVLKSGNHQIIANSQMYKSRQATRVGMRSVIKNSSTSKILEK